MVKYKIYFLKKKHLSGLIYGNRKKNTKKCIFDIIPCTDLNDLHKMYFIHIFNFILYVLFYTTQIGNLHVPFTEFFHKGKLTNYKCLK